MNISFPSFGSSKSIVGLDVGSSCVKAIELSKKGKGGSFELTHLGVAAVPPEAIVQGAFLNSAAITEAIREAIANAKIKTKRPAGKKAGLFGLFKRS